MADARLQFLEASASTYATSAPSTAAHLMHERTKVAEEHGFVIDAGSYSDSCKACGSIPVATVNKASTEGTSKCPVCHRTSTISMVKTVGPGQRDFGKSQGGGSEGKALGHSGPDTQQSTSKTCGPNVSNGTSKQRGRAKKRGGLQAMVERSKKAQTDGATRGLDLMDFMKAG